MRKASRVIFRGMPFWCLLTIALTSAVSVGGIVFFRSRRPAAAPELSPRAVVNAADYSRGGVAPGEIVILYPSHAGPPNLEEWPTVFPRSAQDLAYIEHRPGRASTGETRVFFDGVSAPVIYAQAGQVEAIVPYQVSAGKTTEVVIEYKGLRSRPVKLSVAGRAPAIFTRDASGTGQAAMLNQTGCCNSPRNPSERGSIVSLFATGEGLPPAMEKHRNAFAFVRKFFGFAARADLRPPLWPVRVTVGNIPAETLYAGNVGTLMVNFRVPLNAPIGGSVPIALTVGNSRSAAGVTMAVRSPTRSILIVGGERATRRRLAEILGRGGYEVVLAPNGGEAAAPPGDRPFDLVIMDPPRSAEAGLAMLNAIRKENPLAATVVISAKGGPEVLRSADILGASMVLRTPLNEEAVLTRVRNLLR